MFVETGRDILDQSFRKGRSITGNVTTDEMDNSVKLVQNLITYTNSSLSQIAKIYKNKVPTIQTETKIHNRYGPRKGESYEDFELK